jgi:ABC-type uncharacterized transport system permease subunit
VKISNKDAKTIAVVVADLTFAPSHNQMKLKASFYAHWAGMSQPTEGDISLLTGSRSIQKWWSDPSFKDWFLNKDQTIARLAYLKDLALETAEKILLDPDANAASKVNMIKNILLYEAAISEKQVAIASKSIKATSTNELLKRLESVKGTIDIEVEENT